jgi:molybdenum cofactor sulfurtransferase
LWSVHVEIMHDRVQMLTAWLLRSLLSLRLANGLKAIKLYGPARPQSRGGPSAFNFPSPDGLIVDERVVYLKAAPAGISLRTGCFCNPGAGEVAFVLSPDVLRRVFDLYGKNMSLNDLYTVSHSCDDLLASLGMKSGGAIRVSLGVVSNVADVILFMQFTRTFVNVYP